MVTLRNRTKRIKIVNLTHATVCAGECLCEKTEFRSQTHDAKTGETGVRVLDRRLNASVHLLPGEWSDPLPDAVLNVPQIKAAVKKREVESKEVAAA